jgi:hypothetical protein
MPLLRPASIPVMRNATYPKTIISGKRMFAERKRGERVGGAEGLVMDCSSQRLADKLYGITRHRMPRMLGEGTLLP